MCFDYLINYLFSSQYELWSKQLCSQRKTCRLQICVSHTGCTTVRSPPSQLWYCDSGHSFRFNARNVNCKILRCEGPYQGCLLNSERKVSFLWNILPGQQDQVLLNRY